MSVVNEVSDGSCAGNIEIFVICEIFICFNIVEAESAVVACGFRELFIVKSDIVMSWFSVISERNALLFALKVLLFP